nr:hypothetical protein [Tanacetum cinerariifolium]
MPNSLDRKPKPFRFDHSPAILVMPNSLDRKPKPFKFENYIADKPEFFQKVTDNWKNDVCDKVKEWQRKIDRDPHNIVIKEEGGALLNKYKEVVVDEGKFLMQMTKIEWLKEGDKNTTYFHKILKRRQNKSRIKSISEEHGIRYEGDKVLEKFVKHFEQFLGSKVYVQSIKDNEDIFTCRLNDDEASAMINEVEEIKKSMFDIADDKALGLDGFTASFFKKAWSVIGMKIVIDRLGFTSFFN